MAKLDLTNVLSGYASTTLLNDNSTKIEVALENTLSRDGTGPNYMDAPLDMNGNMILNQANPITVEGFNWEGSWTTARVYQVGDTIEINNSSYICIVEHTAGVFADDLSAGKWQLVASSADLPSQAGNEGKYLTTDGATASWGGVISAFAQTFLDDVDAEAMRNTLGVPSFNSPTFIGEPTAPTPPRFDNSPRLATTAFVQGEGLHYRVGDYNNEINANKIMLASEAGDWWQVAGTGITVTLPVMSTTEPGTTYSFIAQNDFTIKAEGTTTIRTSGGTPTNTYNVLKGEALIITSNRTADGLWYVTSAGFGSNSFNSNKNVTGHLDLPGGIILNWGFSITPATNGAPAVVTFDKAFTTTVFIVVGSFGPVTPTNDITTPLILETYNLVTATFRSHSAADNGFSYIAIGI